jgi:hypothetical protein
LDRSERAAAGPPFRFWAAGSLAETVIERFRAKWIPVRVKRTRQNKSLELRF